jgi:hypothetical protein
MDDAEFAEASANLLAVLAAYGPRRSRRGQLAVDLRKAVDDHDWATRERGNTNVEGESP